MKLEGAPIDGVEQGREEREDQTKMRTGVELDILRKKIEEDDSMLILLFKCKALFMNEVVQGYVSSV